ncbi:MAG TPA: prepilin-type N-terminal cleavage/methylation domain-containing protein [Campylobacteraceae bacterium]|nr:prepilin-type N-terminal cleavage/methylation domain-containing protein [Campylobacteraceae bacterium]
MKKAFTMIEMIFVIVILGILSSIAISKMAVTRDDAIISKGRSEVAAIRNAISLKRNTNILMGKGASYPNHLDALGSSSANWGAGKGLFDYDSNSSDTEAKLLDYPVYTRLTGGWHKVAVDKYAFNATATDVNFTYTPASGSFDCDHTIKLCKDLTE